MYEIAHSRHKGRGDKAGQEAEAPLVAPALNYHDNNEGEADTSVATGPTATGTKPKATDLIIAHMSIYGNNH